ncbi:hypothetical protein [Actinoplanes flavus]|uniref:hypothetical protein n=1 Tax=Actinoplanes flavus TaxID=2820290 RepID=UPI001EE5C323|nr:hypothetical protein [Actinoplanes flavus]
MSRVRTSDTDACPGALRLHAAADGLLARVRLPGGLLTGARLRALRELAEEFGDGALELTSRANIQLRGLSATDAPALATRLRAAGLLPSPTHDNVRNIASPPLPGSAIRALISALDNAILGDPTLAGLPGKFLFALGHVPLSPDVAAVPAPTHPATADPTPSTPTTSPTPSAFTHPEPPAVTTHTAGPTPPATGAHTTSPTPPATGAHTTSPTPPVVTTGAASSTPSAAGTHTTTGFTPSMTAAPTTASPAAPAATAHTTPPVVTTAAASPAAPAATVHATPAATTAHAVVGSGARGHTGGGLFAIRFAGHDTGLRVEADRVVAALIAAAHAFLDEREEQRGDGPAAWRLRELTDGPARVSARVAGALGLTPVAVAAAAPVEATDATDLAGVVAQEDGLAAVGALVPLGRLSGVPLRVLEEADQLVVTSWRGVIVADLPPSAAPDWANRLAAAGLAVAAGSPWSGVTACAGRPGCAKSLADVRADATAAARFVDGLPVHWVGCARACGSPSGPHVRVEATADGYLVARTDGDRSGPARPSGTAGAKSDLAGPIGISGAEGVGSRLVDLSEMVGADSNRSGFRRPTLTHGTESDGSGFGRPTPTHGTESDGSEPVNPSEMTGADDDRSGIGGPTGSCGAEGDGSGLVGPSTAGAGSPRIGGGGAAVSGLGDIVAVARRP